MYRIALYSFEEFADNAGEGGLHLLMGMATVFAALIVLWLVIEIFHVVFSKLGSGGKKPENPVETPETAPVAAAESDDSELVAAISAAIAVYLDRPQSSFRVVSFKRRGNGGGWNR